MFASVNFSAPAGAQLTAESAPVVEVDLVRGSIRVVEGEIGSDVVLMVPAGAKVRARLLAGDITAAAANSTLDLRTSIGRISVRHSRVAFKSSLGGGDHVVAFPVQRGSR